MRPVFAVYVAVVAVFVIAESVIAGKLGAPIDDGWIYMAFARSLAEGDGMSYPGHDGSISAVTGPAWTVVLAVLYWITGSAVAAGKIAGVGTGFAALWGTYRLGLAIGDRRLGVVAAMLLAVSPRFVWGALSFMEVPFCVATVTWGLALHLERRERSLSAWLPALLVLILAGWGRPECFVFPVVAALHRRSLSGIGVCVALLLCYPLYHLWIHGHPLPTTFYAKASDRTPWAVLDAAGIGAALESLALGVGYELGAFTSWLPTFLPVLVPGLILGIARGWRRRDGVAFIAAALAAFVIARGALGFHFPWFQYGRYYVQTWPLFAIVCLAGMDLRRPAAGWALAPLLVFGVLVAINHTVTILYVWEWDFGTDLDIERVQAAIWIPAVATLVIAAAAWLKHRGGLVGRPPVWTAVLFLAPALAFVGYRYGRNVDDTNRLNVAMALEVREVVPEDEVVACHDIGALGFFAQRRLLDLGGLGSPEVTFRDPGVGIPTLLQQHDIRWLCLTDEQANLINPGGQPLPGLPGFLVRERISHPGNVTVAGSTYSLIELVW